MFVWFTFIVCWRLFNVTCLSGHLFVLSSVWAHSCATRDVLTAEGGACEETLHYEEMLH